MSATPTDTPPVSDSVATDCPICFDDITSATGNAVLACNHRFHIMCIVRWFQDQEAASSCPCCRREVTPMENVPLVPEGEEEGDNEEDGDSDWMTEDEEDDSDADSVGTLRRVWTRADGGQWEGHWVLHRPTVTVWVPQEDLEAPEELTEIATLLQRIWRGHRVRRGTLPAPAPAPEEETAVAGLLKLREPPADSWIMQRMLRVD
jgi:hypothetical protein